MVDGKKERAGGRTVGRSKPAQPGLSNRSAVEYTYASKNFHLSEIAGVHPDRVVESQHCVDRVVLRLIGSQEFGERYSRQCLIRSRKIAFGKMRPLTGSTSVVRSIRT